MFLQNQHIAIVFTFFILFLFSSCRTSKQTTGEFLKPEMIVISGGTFKMGDIYRGDNPNAKPVPDVTLSDFAIGKYEVTYRQYDAFAQQTGRSLPEADSLGRGNRAVVNINWDEADAFCRYYGGVSPPKRNGNMLPAAAVRKDNLLAQIV